jgi:hypothetical protein
MDQNTTGVKVRNHYMKYPVKNHWGYGKAQSGYSKSINVFVPNKPTIIP